MEFNRVHKFRVELVTETMSTSTYYFIQQRIEDYKDNFEHEKKNRPMCLLYARRMHLGLRAVQELLMNLVNQPVYFDAYLVRFSKCQRCH